MHQKLIKDFPALSLIVIVQQEPILVSTRAAKGYAAKSTILLL